MQPPAQHVRSLERRTGAGSGRVRCYAVIVSALFCASFISAGAGCTTISHEASPSRAHVGTTADSERETVVRGQNPVDGERTTTVSPGVGGAVTSPRQPSAPLPNPAAMPPAIPALVPAPPDFSPDLSGPGPIVEPALPVQTESWAPRGLSSIARIVLPTGRRCSRVRR